MTTSNLMRRQRGKRLIALYEELTAPNGYDEPFDLLAADAIADILHYVGDKPDVNPALVADRAVNNYMDEL